MNEPLSKDVLYGDFRDNMAKKQKLAMRAAHKALDIPEDDMNINANRTTTGVGIAGVIGIIMASSILPLGLATYLAMKSPADNSAKSPVIGQPVGSPVNKTGRPVEIETRDIEAGKLVNKYRWRGLPDGQWSEWKGYDPKAGISVP